ncbi:MAG TPA: NDMA-dependent alcohol dehydrogenase [Acidimicrobiia bacterium]|nr:NDMA-dependent alcohol dehydrogenase [Acidimicrobiia bacterium]
MKTQAAVLYSQPGKWEVTEVDLDEPKANEVLVKIVAAGLCHSDDHMCTGDMPSMKLPLAGGHEGAGIVEAVGSAVTNVAPGDHIVLSFIPGCGRCRWCASGQQNLCDSGAMLLAGCQLDGTFRMHQNGQDVGQMALISTFSQYTVVPSISCVKIPDDIPFAEACLVGCGVPTGWGSAVNGAGVVPGDVTIVMGVGGVGINSVQGAKHAGASRIIAVDPTPFKRETALQLGATDAVETIGQAAQLAQELTNGQGADNAIITVGVTRGEHIGQAFDAVRKGGTVAVVGIGPVSDMSIPVSPFILTLFQKRLQGVLYGSLSPSKDILRLLSMYQAGQLKLKELVTRTYTLDQINEGYADMHAGRNIRGVITFD